jgi:hypothetical protein
MKSFFIFLFYLVFLTSAVSQSLAAFSDYRNYLMVFDNGVINQAEYMPVKNYKAGGNSVAYVDNSDNFKVFYKGKAYPLADVAPSNYSATDNLVVYYKDRILSVFDNGVATRLPGWASTYAAGDSIVGFLDENSGYYKIYYRGTITNLPDALDVNNPPNFVAGDNIIAYQNIDGKLKAYYRDQVYDLGTNHTSGYQAGASTVAFMDDYNQAFKVFNDGNIATMESLAPKSMQAGDNLIAYVDANSNFKIFYKGSLFTISSVEPQFYSVADNVVVFGTDYVNFSVFYKGKIYLLEKNTPTNYQKDYNSVAYIDSYGYLKLFSDGETKQVSNIKISDYTLSKNVLMFKTGLNDMHFYLDGKAY